MNRQTQAEARGKQVYSRPMEAEGELVVVDGVVVEQAVNWVTRPGVYRVGPLYFEVYAHYLTGELKVVSGTRTLDFGIAKNLARQQDRMRQIKEKK